MSSKINAYSNSVTSPIQLFSSTNLNSKPTDIVTNRDMHALLSSRSSLSLTSILISHVSLTFDGEAHNTKLAADVKTKVTVSPFLSNVSLSLLGPVKQSVDSSFVTYQPQSSQQYRPSSVITISKILSDKSQLIVSATKANGEQFNKNGKRLYLTKTIKPEEISKTKISNQDETPINNQLSAQEISSIKGNMENSDNLVVSKKTTIITKGVDNDDQGTIMQKNSHVPPTQVNPTTSLAAVKSHPVGHDILKETTISGTNGYAVSQHVIISSRDIGHSSSNVAVKKSKTTSVSIILHAEPACRRLANHLGTLLLIILSAWF